VGEVLGIELSLGFDDGPGDELLLGCKLGAVEVLGT
jgi:hypothetical protein